MPQPSRRRPTNHLLQSVEATFVEVVAMLLLDSSRLEQLAAVGEMPVLPWSAMNADARDRYRNDARFLLSQIHAGTTEYHRELVTILGRDRQEPTP